MQTLPVTTVPGAGGCSLTKDLKHSSKLLVIEKKTKQTTNYSIILSQVNVAVMTLPD